MMYTGQQKVEEGGKKIEFIINLRVVVQRARSHFSAFLHHGLDAHGCYFAENGPSAQQFRSSGPFQGRRLSS